MKKIKSFFNGYFDAIKNITWPRFKVVRMLFFVVLIVIILLGIITGLMDGVIQFIISFLYA